MPRISPFFQFNKALHQVKVTTGVLLLAILLVQQGALRMSLLPKLQLVLVLVAADAMAQVAKSVAMVAPPSTIA
jgi:hypothetical protein